MSDGIPAAPAWEEAVATGLPAVASVLAGFTGSFAVAVLFSNASQLDSFLDIYFAEFSTRTIAVCSAFFSLALNLMALERSIVCKAKDTTKLAKPQNMPELVFERHLATIESERANAAKVALGSFYYSLPVALFSLSVLTTGPLFIALVVLSLLWVVFLTWSFVSVLKGAGV